MQVQSIAGCLWFKVCHEIQVTLSARLCLYLETRLGEDPLPRSSQSLCPSQAVVLGLSCGLGASLSILPHESFYWAASGQDSWLPAEQGAQDKECA